MSAMVSDQGRDVTRENINAGEQFPDEPGHRLSYSASARTSNFPTARLLQCEEESLKLRTVCIERRLYALRERVALPIQQKIAARAHASLHGAIAEAESLKARYRSETRDGAARRNSGNRKHKVLAYEVFPAACSKALRAQPLRVRAVE